MPKLPPEQARLRASIAGNESWARTADRAARTQPARDARWRRYLDRARELAPPGATDDDIERRAEHLRRADLQRMALKSAKTRRARKAKAHDETAA